MEWLINRRRMMFNKVIPPDYLTFEDAEFWRICCEHWGDYNETVITDNGDDTVNIVTTFKSMSGDTLKKSHIVDSRQNVDNSQGTYVAGTTKEAVGITQKQCGMVTWIGRGGNYDNHSFFTRNTNILSLNDLRYFTNLTELRGNGGRDLAVYSAFFGCTNNTSVILPESLTFLGDGAFGANSFTSIDIKNVRTINASVFRESKLLSLVMPEGLTTVGGYTFKGSTVSYLDFPSTTTTISRNNVQNSNLIVVCRAETPPSLVTTGNNIAKAIYVPSASIEDYKSATGWSVFSSKIYAIEGSYYENHHELDPNQA